jgi:gentisate 1,2-dioxygenase
MALRRLKECIEELHGSDNAINLECMTTSARTNPNCPASKEYIKWDEVRDFLLMAEEALRAKDLAAQRYML